MATTIWQTETRTRPSIERLSEPVAWTCNCIELHSSTRHVSKSSMGSVINSSRGCAKSSRRMESQLCWSLKVYSTRTSINACKLTLQSRNCLPQVLCDDAGRSFDWSQPVATLETCRRSYKQWLEPKTSSVWPFPSYAVTRHEIIHDPKQSARWWCSPLLTMSSSKPPRRFSHLIYILGYETKLATWKLSIESGRDWDGWLRAGWVCMMAKPQVRQVSKQNSVSRREHPPEYAENSQ